MPTFLRWLFFLPAALLAGVVAGGLMLWCGDLLSDFLGYLYCGAFAAAAFMGAGLYVAPVRSERVKWILISITVAGGIAATIGSATGKDKVEMVGGIAAMLFSLLFALLPARDIVQRMEEFSRRLPLLHDPPD